MRKAIVPLAFAAALATAAPLPPAPPRPAFDPLIDAARCLPAHPLLAQVGATAGAAATDDEPALLDGLGVPLMAASTTSPRAQAYFAQGLALAFGFNHAEARRAFRAAQRADPRCAICHWGEALAWGPNLNAQWMSRDATAAALAALGRADALADAASDFERALIAALRTRYADGGEGGAQRKRLDEAYADAMRGVAERADASGTVRVLHAEALMQLSPWSFWERDGTTPRARTAEVATLLEGVLAREPGHAGAIHLYIHLLEASARAADALPHARRLGALMPGAGHLVHMPSHIYYRLGLHRDSLRANLDALASDARYFARAPSEPVYARGYHGHNIHFALASALMGGDARDALALADRLDALIPDAAAQASLWRQQQRSYALHARALFAPAEQLLAAPDPGAALPLLRAAWRYGRVLAFSERGEWRAAAREAASIEGLATHRAFSADDDGVRKMADVVRITHHAALGRIALARGRAADAAAAFAAAVAIQDRFDYLEPPLYPFPLRQAQGAALLQAGRSSEAIDVLSAGAERSPGNGRLLHRLARAQREAGDAVAAARSETRLAEAWWGDRAALDTMRF